MLLPWVAHAYTALGAVLALAAAVDVFAGDFRRAFIWLGAQIVVDATDGVLARALRVKERLPNFDGARLDDIIDYLTYVFVPALIAIRAELVPPAWGLAVGGAMLLASAYGFSQSDAKVKTDDYFFTGFPSYWNLVVLYLYLWGLPPEVNAALLIALAIMVFVPIRYVYPSRTATLSGLTNALGVIWGLLLIWIVWRLPATDGPWIALSMIFPIYYLALSFWLHFTRRS